MKNSLTITDAELERELVTLERRREVLAKVRALRQEVAALEEKTTPPELLRLVRITAEIRQLLPAQIFDKCRERAFVESRFIVFHVARALLGLCDTDIARGLDIQRGQVAHGRAQCVLLQQIDANYSAQVAEVMRRFSEKND